MGLIKVVETIFADEKTFAAKAEKEIAKLWNKAPSFTTVALTTLTFAAPLIETAVTLDAGAPAGAAITAILNKAETDLVAAKGLITAIGPTLSVQNLLAGVSSDLTNVLTALNTTNPTSVANVKLVIQELDALVAAFPASSAATTAPAAPAATTAAPVATAAAATPAATVNLGV